MERREDRVTIALSDGSYARFNKFNKSEETLYISLGCWEVEMLRLRSEDRFTILAAALSMTGD